MDEVLQYREGVYIVIEDDVLAKQYISMAVDIEEGMLVRVEHNFGTYLVCETATDTDTAALKHFPPSTGEFAGDERREGEKTTYR